MRDVKDLHSLVDEVRAALADNLVSLILYGSHARGEAHSRSDVNLFIVVKDHSPEALHSLLKVVPTWQKRGIVPPVIFREDQLRRSGDSFAMEFTEMAAAHRVLYGSDPLTGFTPDWDALRRELEREARQKRIALTRHWLAAREDDRLLRGLIRETLPGYLTLLRCTLMLKQKALRPLTAEQVLSEIQSWPDFSANTWRMLKAVAKQEEKPSGAELKALMRAYIHQAITLVSYLDQM